MARSVLIAGGYPHHLPIEVKKAFERAGWRAEFFDTSPESPWHRPLIKPLRKFIHNVRIQRHPETLDNTLLSNLGWRSRRWLKEVERLRPEAALLIRGNRFALPWLRKSSVICPHVCWMVEPFSRLDRLIEEATAGVYRKIFVYAWNYVGELKRHGIESEYYPHHAPKVAAGERVLNTSRRYDWSFLGSHSPWREECLNAVLARFPNGYVMGPRWEKVAGKNRRFRPVVHRGYHGMEESQALYLDSRVGLDIAPTSALTRNGVTMRFIELLACGCRVVCQPNEEIARLPWDVSSHVETFSTPRELSVIMEKQMAASASQIDPKATLQLAGQMSGYESLITAFEACIS